MIGTCRSWAARLASSWQHVKIVRKLSGEYTVMKTATAALLKRDLDEWSSIFEAGKWEVERVIYPREL